MQNEGAADGTAGALVAVRMMGITKTSVWRRSGPRSRRLQCPIWRSPRPLGGERLLRKSTLLKILRGVLPSDMGTIEIGGAQLTEHNADTVRRAGVAMIFQEMSLVPTLSVAQNIFLNREPHSRLGLVDDERIVREARQLFDEFGNEHRPRVAPWQNSAPVKGN